MKPDYAAPASVAKLKSRHWGWRVGGRRHVGPPDSVHRIGGAALRLLGRWRTLPAEDTVVRIGQETEKPRWDAGLPRSAGYLPALR